MPFISFDHITFGYDGESNTLFNDFSLSIEKGEKAAIKSDSGTGKTTLLRLLLGFERPDSGEILFDGKPISEDNFSTIRTSAAWLPQDLNIGDDTVEKVISDIFEFNHNSSLKPGKEQVQQTLSALGLPVSIAGKPFRDLSTGQRQRVGLALCHLLDRPLLLLDEPTSALDKTSKQNAIDLLFTNTNRTIISTTHDPFWLERCDKIIELN